MFGMLLVAALTLANPAQNPEALRGMRYLALSPDGSQIAFSYWGDIWVAPTNGGRAEPITSHVEMEQNPVWSHDGKKIAFASNRSGNNDIYVMNADGGRPKRLTWSSGEEVPTGWTADDKAVLFSSTRDEGYPGIFSVDVETTRLKRYFLDNQPLANPSMSPDGQTLLYNRISRFPWFRPRYSGSGAAQIWTSDLEGKNRKLVRNTGFQHLWPTLASDGKSVYCVTVSELTPSSRSIGAKPEKYVDNVNRTPNVYRVAMNGSATRITDFIGGPVRFVTVASKEGTVAFEQEGDLYVMRPGKKAVKVQLTAAEDDKVNYSERLILTGGANQTSLSPDGKSVAFVVRGEIWTAPVQREKGPNANDAKQITSWEGLDGNPIWHPLGKSLFITSDREGSEALYKVDLETLEAQRLTPNDADVINPNLTPDRTRVSYWQSGSNGGLYTVPIGGGSPTRIIDMPRQFNWESSIAWSPDGRYVAYVGNSAGGTSNIQVFDTKTGTDTNLTKLNATHGQPSWSADGKILYFASDRSGGGVYAFPVQKPDEPDSLLELKYTKPTGVPSVEIDFDNAQDRFKKLFGNYPVSNLLSDPENGDIWFIQDGDLWRANYAGENVQRVTNQSGSSSFELSTDKKQLVFVRGGLPTTMNIRVPQFPLTTLPFRADWTRDVRSERHAAFFEFWRRYNRSFYDGNFHGRDWKSIRDRYEPLLQSVAHRNEMALLLNMVVGELESSHSEVRPAAGNPPSETTAHPGFTFDYSYQGVGIRIGTVPKGAPGSYEKTRLKPGEYVMSINGKQVSVDEWLARDVLNEQAGRDLVMQVNDSPTLEGARTVKYRALSQGEWGKILYDNRIEARRSYVEKASGGKLTYLHIAGMGGGNFDAFNREAWEFLQGKEGLIIDVRDNGGGNISDRLIDILERVPHGYYQDRDGYVTPAPQQSWNKPTVVMHAESSYSNAEMFPYAMKQRRLATLVGMPTPGYVIWTFGMQLVDGTNARMPTAGVYRLDGTPMENMGQQPDFKVEITPEQFFSDRDPQLDKAIEVLMKQVKK